MITYGIEKGSNKVNEELVHPQIFPTYSKNEIKKIITIQNTTMRNHASKPP